MIAGLLVNENGLMIFLMFLICFVTADFFVHLSSCPLKAFSIAMIVLSLLLAGYACYRKWHQATARLKQTQEVQP